MSLLKSKLLFSVSRNLVTSATRNAYWNKEWKPTGYPVTEEQNLASAKKYALLPVEYIPVPDDGEGTGDYPDLKPISAESRDPFYPWDFPEYKRNFGEVMHENATWFTEDRLNINHKPRFSQLVMFSCLASVLGGSYLLMLLTEDTCFIPAAKQHLPAPGVKHYRYD